LLSQDREMREDDAMGQKKNEDPLLRREFTRAEVKSDAVGW